MTWQCVQIAPTARQAFTKLYCGRKSVRVEQGEARLDQLMAQKRYLVDVCSAG